MSSLQPARKIHKIRNNRGKQYPERLDLTVCLSCQTECAMRFDMV